MNKILTLFLIIILLFNANTFCQKTELKVREHLSMDKNWKFAYGHPFDTKEDYFHGTLYFTYITKTGNGDGPAAQNFDDRSWRTLDIPHDWAVEQKFAANASHSHGYKTVGYDFPETSVGWYRKLFDIPASDSGKRLSIQFDGIHRDAKIFINGFYLGRELSGYYDIERDLTPYLNYGGENVIAVRVDASMEEGWFYEGAGIYRHVWLTKTNPLHVGYNGTFVTSVVNKKTATLTIQTEVDNDTYTATNFDLVHKVLDPNGKEVAAMSETNKNISAFSTNTITSTIEVKNPLLWSIENPNLYTLKTEVIKNGKIVDDYLTTFGIRTLKFDANEGFFLNGEHVIIKGTCNHQDHAGVGTAIPDALQTFRIKTLKSMGSNAYRASHNPPTPELLEACDKLGMLVMVENRLLSTSPDALNRLERMIKRDRNHPSVILWSLGNEEWAVEGNLKGKRISNHLQAFAKKLDTTRPYLAAASGGWGQGVDLGLDMIGFNYLNHGNPVEHHKNFPDQLCIGSEESNTQGTRGVYFDDTKNGHMAYVDRSPGGTRIENGWKFYDENAWATGLFIWTGFDYRGEPNPLSYPAVNSQFGITDLCGFPKEPYYYLKSWWDNEPFIKITPHWNWPEKKGDTILVRVNSNCNEVELFLNDKSLGKQTMEKNSLLNWNVVYEPGTLLAKGYCEDKLIVEDKVKTTGNANSIALKVDKTSLKANGKDIAVINVMITDKEGDEMPIANNEITFNINGLAKIIGVGNGDPASHEPDVFFTAVDQLLLDNGKIAQVNPDDKAFIKADFNDSDWEVYSLKRTQIIFPKDSTVAIRVEFEIPEFTDKTEFTLFAKSLAINQSIYVNEKLIAENIERESKEQVFKLDNTVLKPGKNLLVYKGKALFKRTEWEDLNTNPGLIQVVNQAQKWKRKAFNGLAQVIIQASDQPGVVVLTASSPGLKKSEIKITTIKSAIKPHVP